ncbi:MAG: carboxypeptidase regulatory-like domain-containing protein [Polyangiaceae bacterium]
MTLEAGTSVFDRRAWLKVGGLIVALLAIPIAAWIFLSTTPTVTATTSSAKRAGRGPLAVESAAPSDSGAGRVLSGKVLDEAGKPLGNATVVFMPTGQSIPRYTARSEEDGSFFVDNAPPSSGSLSAKLEGWVGTPIMVGADDNDASGFTLKLHVAAGVKGQVVDSDGKPVDHAMVTCDGGKGQAGTGPDGSYKLLIDDEGCTATATHPDFGSSEPSRVRAGARNILELPSPGGIAGNVYDEQGRPVAAFTVSIESFIPTDKDMDRLGGMSQPFTDASGAFELKGLARGRYVLAVTTSGRPPAKSDAIEVGPGRTTRGIRITLSKGIALFGVVTDRTTHQPIRGVQIGLDAMTSSFGPTNVAPATSDESGSYRLEGVPAGVFSVRFSHPQYGDRILSLDGRGKSELRGDVDLAPGSPGSMEMSGIGATLGQGAGFVLITQVLPDGPAEGAGVRAGDHILRIDGDDATSFSVSDCIQRLRGPEGSVVIVTMERDGERREVRMTRARIVR